MASMSMPTRQGSWCQSLPRSPSHVATTIPLVTKNSLHCWLTLAAPIQALHQHSKLLEMLWSQTIMAIKSMTLCGVLMNEIPMLKNPQSRDEISWGAEMHNSNTPPAKTALVPYKKQQQTVFLQGPHGPIDLSTLKGTQWILRQPWQHPMCPLLLWMHWQKLLAMEVKASKCWLEAEACD